MAKPIDDSSVENLAEQVRKISRAIIPGDAAPNRDATGGSVDSLTEAVMGVTAGLVQIADAINNLAAAVRERDE